MKIIMKNNKGHRFAENVNVNWKEYDAISDRLAVATATDMVEGFGWSRLFRLRIWSRWIDKSQAIWFEKAIWFEND